MITKVYLQLILIATSASSYWTGWSGVALAGFAALLLALDAHNDHEAKRFASDSRIAELRVDIDIAIAQQAKRIDEMQTRLTEQLTKLQTALTDQTNRLTQVSNAVRR